MKNIKVLAILGIAFFASSTINAQVSVGVNIGLPSVVISGQYERGYEPQRRNVEYREERVIYVEREDCDDRWHDDRRYYEKNYKNKKYHNGKHYDKKYKGKGHKKHDDDDWDD
ncbi:hypothetical protein FQU23_011945 [Flavobacterium sp. XN-5]|uniref:hypothetical protein n=1 Tax=Flavobacterium sp. XN-5 TaxID=2599390 RepID=UPI0011C8E542|nr:hypothetical protein [Flavobacterium sp. XN-5]NGY38221.1 hypothetical protein [Flavobacterium sp. XN-5]